MWLRQIKWYHAVRGAAALLLAEQGAEALFQGVSLAKNPGLVIAALAAFGIPIPERRR